MSCGLAFNMPLAGGIQLLLIGGVAAADVEVDVAAGAVRLVMSDVVQLAACVGRAAGAYRRSDGDGRYGGRGAGHGGEGCVVCEAGRLAGWRMCRASSL